MREWTPLDFQKRLQLVREIQAHLGRMGTPTQHPFWQSHKSAYLPTEAQELRQLFENALAKTREVLRVSATLAEGLHLTPPETAASVEILARATLRA